MKFILKLIRSHVTSVITYRRDDPDMHTLSSHWLLKTSAVRWCLALAEDKYPTRSRCISLLHRDLHGEEMANSDRVDTAIAFVYRGTFVHSTQQTALQILEDALLGVDAQGKVCGIPEYIVCVLHLINILMTIFN